LGFFAGRFVLALFVFFCLLAPAGPAGPIREFIRSEETLVQGW